jgi:protein-S-isoprenylcysteine O-methyltransferase Ste14
MWFEFWFFVAFPAGILTACDQSWAPEAGVHWVVALAMIGGGHVLMLSTIAAFLRTGGTHLPFDPPDALVDSGFYRRVRNPMYGAYLTIAVGIALLYLSMLLAVYALVFWGLMHIYLTQIEEPRLRARFGADYERYCATTGRWLPRR